MIGQIIIELAIFPVLGALWLSVVRRIDRVEVKMDKSTERMARCEVLVSNEKASLRRFIGE